MDNDKSIVALEAILKAIVDNPDEVVVTRSTDEMGVLLTVKVNQRDAGLVIGRKGDTINKIREVMRLIGMSMNARINVKLDVPDVPSREDSASRIAQDLIGFKEKE